MPKTFVEREGRIHIPDQYLERYGLSDGENIYVWLSEEGLVIQRPGADVRHAYIEVTSLCNLNCVTCVRNVWSDKIGHMNMDTFHQVMEQLGDFPGIQGVSLAGFGEPLYHPEITSMARAVKNLGLELTISTNGTLLSPELAEELADIGLDRIIISIDSSHPQLFGHIRSGADLSCLLSNMRALNEVRQRRRSKRPVVSIEFVAMRCNVHEMADLPRLGSNLMASSIIVTNLLPHTEDMKEEILYGGSVELPKCNGWPVHLNNSWMLWGAMSHPRMRWGADRYCRFVGSRSIAIAWDGGVSPCYALMHSYPYYIFGRLKNVSRYTVGNVLERSLLDIWTCEEYARFRSKVRSFTFPSCVDCGINCGYTNFNRDCWGADPSCADCLYAQGIVRCP